MHKHTQAQNHEGTLIYPQTKNHSDPRSGRWQTSAFNVITEINESSRLKHSDTHTQNQNASGALKDTHYEAADMQISLQTGMKTGFGEE